MYPAKATVPVNGKHAALLISPVEEDHQTLQQLFQQHGWTLHAVRSLGPATRMLSENCASVVITERDLPGDNWKNVLEMIQVLPHPPLVIVISLHADNYLWAEALNLGAYDVLAKPLDQTEAFRVLTSAWIHQQEACAIRSGHPKREIRKSASTV